MALSEDKIQVKNWKQANLVLNRLNRKSQKYVVGKTPVLMIHGFCGEVPEDGVVYRYMFALPGRITNLVVFVETNVKDKLLDFRVELLGTTGGEFLNVSAKPGLNNVVMDYKVQIGDRIRVTTDAQVQSVEFAAVFVPDPDTAKVERVLLDSILALEEPSGVVDEGV